MVRRLLDSSWMRFGPAGREYEWPTGAPLTRQNQEDSWTELDLGLERGSGLLVFVLLALCVLLVLVVLAGFLYRRCSRSKLSLANVIALDLEDPENGAEILSSLTWNAERLNSTSSDGSDGVFIMVYLPPPYEETLTKITRAASLSSSRDAESMKTEDLEARLCPDSKTGGHFV